MSQYPSWRYGPNGQAKVCESEADIPAGWEDHPSKVKEGRSIGLKDLPEIVEDIVSDAAAQIAAMDGDGDGTIGGSLPKAKRKPKADAFDKAVDAVVGVVRRARRKVTRDDISF